MTAESRKRTLADHIDGPFLFEIVLPANWKDIV